MDKEAQKFEMKLNRLRYLVLLLTIKLANNSGRLCDIAFLKNFLFLFQLQKFSSTEYSFHFTKSGLDCSELLLDLKILQSMALITPSIVKKHEVYVITDLANNYMLGCEGIIKDFIHPLSSLFILYQGSPSSKLSRVARKHYFHMNR